MKHGCNYFFFLVFLFLSGCATEESAPAPVDLPAPAPETKNVLSVALQDFTGLKLGMTVDEVLASARGECSPKGYFGGDENGSVTELVCMLEENEGGVVRVGFSKPEKGHKTWRLYLKLTGDPTRDSPVILKMLEAYGPPKGEHMPLELWWRQDRQNLRIIGEKEGLRLQLWDIRLNL
ncbi:MAG: hypothetical protein OEY85_05630 [Rhodospirillales bacterium]|nr:hypothetical protein [Rhodospirillales bacterium]